MGCRHQQIADKMVLAMVFYKNICEKERLSDFQEKALTNVYKKSSQPFCILQRYAQ